MFRKSDYFILLAVMISFFISAYLWFVVQDREQAIFTAIWIPAIFGCGAHFNLAALPKETARQSALCVPSHSGCCAVCLQAQNHTFLDSVASNFTGVNSEPLCEPSQNGCFALLPQAHHQ